MPHQGSTAAVPDPFRMLMGVSTTRVRRDVWTTTNDISISFDELTAFTYTKHEATHKCT